MYIVHGNDINPNPIIDGSCPCIVGGIKFAAELSVALGSTFKLRYIDCKSFVHGCGIDCSEGEVVLDMWNLVVRYVFS